jgi:hypothetical protein
LAKRSIYKGGMTERVRPAGDSFGNGRHLKVTITGETYTLVGDWPL